MLNIIKHNRWSLFGVLILAGCPKSDDLAAAHVRAIAGDVSVRTSEESDAAPAEVGQALVEGNVVVTGADGKATVEFRGGNRVDLRPNTSLVVRKSGGTTAEFGAILLSGSATASSSGQGVLLAIGTPFGLAELGAGESSIELSYDAGFKVLVGEVILITEAGERKTLTIEGLAFEVKDGPEEVVLDPMQFVLLSNPKQVQVRRKGQKKWRAPRKRETLAPGDAIRTRKATRTVVQFGEIAGLTLKPNTEMVFTEAGAGKTAHAAKYALTIGNVLVNLTADEKMGAKHEIEVAGLTIAVQPGLKEAAVEISAGKNGRAQVTVRFGRVALSDGTVVGAGSTVSIQGGKVIGEVRPLASTQLDLQPRSASVVYYTSAIPAIEFGWKKEEGAESYEFQVASDRNFAKTVFREKLESNSFVYDRFGPGRYHWRVKGAGKWSKGVLTIAKNKQTDCLKCERENHIHDTGEKTVVYFQKALPAITLHWKPADGAGQYRLRVYPENDIETPVVDDTPTETHMRFKEGKLPEGQYFWHVVAQDTAGKELKQGRMNTLTIAFDNAITDLAIKSPRHNQKVTSKSLVTKGEVQLGAKLMVNGKRAHLDKKGRFKQTVSLQKGSNQIVYRTLSTDGVERFYVRQVYRR